MFTLKSTFQSSTQQANLWLIQHPARLQLGLALAVVGLALALAVFTQTIAYACPAASGGSTGGCGS